MTFAFRVPRSVREAARERLEQRRRMEAFYSFRDDPIGFFEGPLGLQVWSRQRALLELVRDHDRVGVRAGQKVSKSCSAIGCALWWTATAPNRRAILTAPTWTQVKNVLWRELEAQAPAITRTLGGEVPKDPASKLTFMNGSEIFGISTAKAENLAGLSSRGGILFVVDEASGYPNELFNVIRGNSAGGAKILAISNPTLRPDCTWYPEIFKSSVWRTMRINSEDSPNVIARREVIPGLALYEWLLEMREEFGPDYEEHPQYKIRVLGEFAAESEESIVSMELVEAARERWRRDAIAYGPLRVGVDPARYGVDDSAIAMVRGHHAYPFVTLSGRRDGFEIAEAVIAAVMPLRRLPIDEIIPVGIDHVGPGAATVDALRRLIAERGLPMTVVEHEGFRAAHDEDRYASRRAEVWYQLADWMRDGGTLPPDDDIGPELLTARKEHDARGRLSIEKKEKTKRRGKGSPNKADSLSIAVSVTLFAAPDYDAGDEVSRGRAQWM